MLKVLGSLMSICPNLWHIKLDKKRAHELRDMLQVLKSHSKSYNYTIQFFMEPLIENCKCKACNDRVIKHVCMPREIYKSLGLSHVNADSEAKCRGDKEIEYTSFADAQTPPFVNEHQP